MNILYTNFLQGDGGGHTTYLLALTRALSRHHHIHVAAPENSRLLSTIRAENNATPLPIDFATGLARQLAEQYRLRRLVRQQHIDLIHVNGARDHRFVMQALLGMRRPPIVLTKHNSKACSSFGNAVRSHLATDRVIAVSAHTSRLLRRSPYRQHPIDIIRNGVDLQHFKPAPAVDGLAFRQRWTVDPDALVLVSNAGTDEYKGWIDLVRAIARLPASIRQHVHVALAGREPAARLREEVTTLGLSEQVHFTGLLADPRPFIAAGDAGFVLSYEVETISFACREMMACGKPVLVSNYAGLPENIHVGWDGWVVPARKVSAITSLIQAMYARRGELPQLGAAARRHAEADFGLNTFISLTEASYRAAMAAA